MVAFVLSWFFVSSTAGRAAEKLDVTGALLLAVGLSALLIAIAEGSGWGWGATQTIGLFVVAVVFLVALGRRSSYA